MNKKLRFLVVDDDEIDRMTVRRSLTKAGFNLEIEEACDAEHAIQLVTEQSFDFGFLDYMLPDSDGLTLLKELRCKGFTQPIVVLTGQGDEQVAVDLMKAGASDYISKSTVEPQRLRKTVTTSLRIYRAERQTEKVEAKLRANNELLKQKNKVLKAQKQRIEDQNQKLIEAVRLKSEFIATISHELRTPMNSVIGFSQVLERQVHGELSDRQLEMVNRILTNGHQLQALINDLLDFSKIGAGGMQLQVTSLDLHQLVRETVADFRAMASKKSLALTFQCDLDDVQVVNDAVRVRQVLTNLLSNAIKFTDVGEIHVGISPSEPLDPEASEPQPCISISVSDPGIGIIAEQQENIFDPFRQLDQSITRKRAGTGLGLAITQSLVRLMGGRIQLDSTVGQGSTFTVIVPRYVSPS